MAFDQTAVMSQTINEIKKRLKDNKKRQKDLAKAAGITESAVSQMLNGHTAISTQHIESFAKVLGGSLEHWKKLFDDDMDEKQKDAGKDRIRLKFQDEAGHLVELPHADNYPDDPQAAGEYMASLITNLHKAGYKNVP